MSALNSKGRFKGDVFGIAARFFLRATSRVAFDAFKLGHIGAFESERWMDVAIQSDLDRGMAENLTQAFDVKTNFNAARRKRVTKGMEMGPLQTQLIGNFRKSSL